MASSFTSTQHQQQQQHHQQYPAHASIAPQATTRPHQTPASNLGGRELKLIASSFVKQYYTLLNKAPCYIHNFYNHDSTFIHGTIEMGSDNHTEPVVGREKIEEKMRELQLNDCRAKIKQIDCLETLSGGLVLQVIGELSNDGKPMRRFLQTFVLSPSPDQSRHDGDPHTHNKPNDSRRGVQISENSANSSHNQKFYVLNSIFRYQDDGTDSEFEDDGASIKANTSVDNGTEQVASDDHNSGVKAGPATQPQAQQPQKVDLSIEQSKNSPKLLTPPQPAPSSEQQRRNEVKVVASNGTANAASKSEISEKVPNENGKDDNQPKIVPAPTNSAVETSTTPTVASQQSSTAAPVNAAPRSSNEPKTWANMVRNAIPPPVALQAGGTAPIKEQQSLNQANQAQSQSQQQQIPHQHHQQQQHQQQQHQQQQQQQQQSSHLQNEQQQSNISNTNTNPNRRRHMIRKTSNNKTGTVNGSGGGNGTGNSRPMKYRPPRPAAAATPTSKPAA